MDMLVRLASRRTRMSMLQVKQHLPFALARFSAQQVSNSGQVANGGERGVIRQAIVLWVDQVVKSSVEDVGQIVGGTLGQALALGRVFGTAGSQTPDARRRIKHVAIIRRRL